MSILAKHLLVNWFFLASMILKENSSLILCPVLFFIEEAWQFLFTAYHFALFTFSQTLDYFILNLGDLDFVTRDWLFFDCWRHGRSQGPPPLMVARFFFHMLYSEAGEDCFVISEYILGLIIRGDDDKFRPDLSHLAELILCREGLMLHPFLETASHELLIKL